MSLTPSLKPLVFMGFLSIGLSIVGCSDSGFESNFVYSEGTLSLVREAQDGTKENPGVKKLIDSHFGDPQHLKAWDKMPLDFGGIISRIEGGKES